MDYSNQMPLPFGEDEMPVPFSGQDLFGGVSDAMDSLSTGFGSGLNLLSGAFGLIGLGMQDQVTQDQLDANLSQIKIQQEQNTSSYLQKTTANTTKVSSVLSSNRVAAAGSGISMDSGSLTEMLQRNLNAYDQDQLSSFANYSYTKQALNEKAAAARQQAEDSEDSGILGAVASFF